MGSESRDSLREQCLGEVERALWGAAEWPLEASTTVWGGRQLENLQEPLSLEKQASVTAGLTWAGQRD